MNLTISSNNFKAFSFEYVFKSAFNIAFNRFFIDMVFYSFLGDIK